jgi:hypothetical protein
VICYCLRSRFFLAYQHNSYRLRAVSYDMADRAGNGVTVFKLKIIFDPD